MNNIWIATDLHLWNQKEKREHPYRSLRNIGKLGENFGKSIEEDDLFIFLGDLCDPSVTDINKLKPLIQSLNGYKVITKGNHDVQEDDFYREIGFDEVCDICKVHNIIFSHKPIAVAPDELNIHGHLHTEIMSTSGYQHINAYAANFDREDQVILLDDLISSAAVQELDLKPEDHWVNHIREKFDKYTALDGTEYPNVIDLTDRITLNIDEEVDSLDESVVSVIKGIIKKLTGQDNKEKDAQKRAEYEKLKHEIKVQYKPMNYKAAYEHWDFTDVYAKKEDAMASMQSLIAMAKVYLNKIPTRVSLITGADLVKELKLSNKGKDSFTYNLTDYFLIFDYGWITNPASFKQQMSLRYFTDVVDNIARRENDAHPEYKGPSYIDWGTIEDVRAHMGYGTKNESVHKQPLDEILFPDIDSVEYFEQDDDYKPGKRKKEPMADGEMGIVSEAAASSESNTMVDRDMTREEKERLAKKYDLRPIGQERPTEVEERVHKETPMEREKRRNDERAAALKKARKAKKRKQLVRKIKSHLPGVKNEEAYLFETGDVDDSALDHYDEEKFDKDGLYGALVHVHQDREFPKEGDLDPSITESYLFEPVEKFVFLDRINEAAEKDDGKLYPVYVVLSFTNTMMGNIIRKVSGATFSHVSISFDPKLKTMYSFGRKSSSTPMLSGFAIEDFTSPQYRDAKDGIFAVYIVPSTKAEIERMKKRVDYFVQNASKFRFDVPGLIKNFIGKVDNPEYSWFCSRFVSDVLNTGRPDEKYVAEPSLEDPEDFTREKWAIFVHGGKIKDFSQRTLDRITKKILREEELRRKSIKNEAVFDFDGLNPYTETVLNYQLAVMDESVFDDFVQYVKSFKLKFDKDGNIIVLRRDYDQLDAHFRHSLKMIKACEKAGNVEGVKEELAKINYMINLINDRYVNAKVDPKQERTKKDMIDLRSVMINTFQQHLKWVTGLEPKFNFQSYYDSSKYGKDVEVPKTVLYAAGKAVVTALA